MVVFDLAGELSLDGDARRQWRRCSELGKKRNEREGAGASEDGEQRSGGAALLIHPAGDKGEGGSGHGAGSMPPCRAGTAATGKKGILQKVP